MDGWINDPDFHVQNEKMLGKNIIAYLFLFGTVWHKHHEQKCLEKQSKDIPHIQKCQNYILEGMWVFHALSFLSSVRLLFWSVPTFGGKPQLSEHTGNRDIWLLPGVQISSNCRGMSAKQIMRDRSHVPMATYMASSEPLWEMTRQQLKGLHQSTFAADLYQLSASSGCLEV